MSADAPFHALISDVSIDGFIDGRMLLEQPRKGHRIGTDAILLAACAPQGARTFADLGCGVGAVGIAVALMQSGTEVTLVDNDPEICSLARRNVERNGLRQRMRVVEANAFGEEGEKNRAGLTARSVDVVLTNPPFFSPGTGRPSPDARKRQAHLMQGGDLDGWMRMAAYLLEPGGSVVVIHRAEALGMLLQAMKRRFGELRLVFLHKSATEPASRVIIKGTLGSKAPLAILPPIYLHEPDGSFTAQSHALHCGRGRLNWKSGAVDLIDSARLHQ